MATDRPECSTKGCANRARSKKGGLCHACYQRQWRAERSPSLSCEAPGCSEPVHSLGLCTVHYQRLKTHGQLDLPEPGPKPVCSTDGCDEPATGLGLCGTHYQAARRADPTRPRCSHDDCERALYAKGLCNTHYQAALRAAKVGR